LAACRRFRIGAGSENFLLGRAVAHTIFATLLLLALVACGALGIDTSLVALNDALYSEFVRGDAAAVSARLPSKYTAAETAEALVKAGTLVPNGPARTARVVGQHALNSPAGTEVQLIVGYDYGEKGVIFATRWHRAKSMQPWSLLGFTVDALPPEFSNAPTLAPAALPPPKPPA
jgi:hypothetical protein